MGYQYHVAYVCLSRSGGIGFGSVEVSRPSPLASPGEVTEMGEDIARDQGLERAVVLNVVSFGPVTGPAGGVRL
ncbi:hypothetical protein HMPREF1316_0512 [Olsenella profusa F0195]|uniref:Uncharacterized protein n=2 Tax=Olsenella profusa TaxID=138595 RepID=U2V2B2_9ACTN|nr:hypothetical protein HMPREF1316_0512 [Olsenella profusa F0195]